jgi:peptidoglycan/LPS O-acetylase OafA/YrhL
VRRDIQALRGFSIVVVLLYHAQFGWLKGGFLGVDIFFVISGFVITTKLMEGEGSFGKQIKEFYLRRAKRILPASLTVTLVTSIFAIFYLPALERSRYSIDALASALFSANLNFARVGNDYLAQSSAPSPFLHYWSLGVEEQFYLLWPILFLVIYRKRKTWIWPTLLVTAVIGIWYTTINPIASFYLPFSRFWEFFAGIVLAMNPNIRLPRIADFPIAIAGWATIFFAVIWVNTSDPTPGFTTIIAIAGAMLVLLARVDVRPQFILPWLGDYSFSLYLVHWPVVVFFIDRNTILPISNQVEIVVIALLLSLVLTQFIEKPMRFQKRYQISLPKWGVVLALGSLVSFGSFALSASASGSIKLDKTVPVTYKDGCHLSFGQAWPLHECVYGDKKSTIEVILAGDSHAAQWFPALEKLAIERKWKLTNLTKSSCPATTLETMRNGKFDSSCAIWQVKVLNLIKDHKPALVILSNFTEYHYPLKSSTNSYAKTWVTGEMKFISEIPSKVLYIEDTPKPSSQVTDFSLARSETTLVTRKTLTTSGAIHYLDPTSWLCAGKCSINFEGFNAYRDATHISVATSLNLAKRLESVIPL